MCDNWLWDHIKILRNNKQINRSSSHDGGVRRNPLLAHKTKSRIATKLKSINNQKCQKIKLHGTPTTKELNKFSQTHRRDGDVQLGRQKGPLARQRTVGARWGWLNVKLKTQASWGFATVGETPSLTQQSFLESGARAEKVSGIVPSLTVPPQIAPHCSKEGCLTQVNT